MKKPIHIFLLDVENHGKPAVMIEEQINRL